MARPRKTASAVATISGEFRFSYAKFVFALSTDGAWFVKITRMTRMGDETTRWTGCESPLDGFGIAADRLVGNVAFEVEGDFVGAGPLDGFGAIDKLWVCGDIGHRERLPRIEAAART